MKAKGPAFSEADIGADLVPWLEDLGWDVYPEAEFRGVYHAGRADIAAVRAGKLWIIEVKKNLSIALLEQAARWCGSAHYVSICVPDNVCPGPVDTGFVRTAMRAAGIGALSWSATAKDLEKFYQAHPTLRSGELSKVIKERIGARQCQSASRSAPRLITQLHPDMKRCTAGQQAGGHSTPWSRTMRAVVEYIQKNPGANVSEIVRNVSTHYSSASGARSGIATWLTQGRFASEVTCRREGKSLRFYPIGDDGEVAPPSTFKLV